MDLPVPIYGHHRGKGHYLVLESQPSISTGICDLRLPRCYLAMTLCVREGAGLNRNLRFPMHPKSALRHGAGPTFDYCPAYRYVRREKCGFEPELHLFCIFEMSPTIVVVVR